MPLRTRTLIARTLRRNSTNVEKRLWQALRMMKPWKFRRQHPVGRRIVDFACPEQKLAIELDGGQHADKQQADAERTTELARDGYRVIRFWNSEVFENLEGVLQSILTALEQEQPPPHPDPLRPPGRRGNSAP